MSTSLQWHMNVRNPGRDGYLSIKTTLCYYRPALQWPAIKRGDHVLGLISWCVPYITRFPGLQRTALRGAALTDSANMMAAPRLPSKYWTLRDSKPSGVLGPANGGDACVSSGLGEVVREAPFDVVVLMGLENAADSGESSGIGDSWREGTRARQWFFFFFYEWFSCTRILLVFKPDALP